MILLARQVYSAKRPPGQYDPGRLMLEFQRIEAAIPSPNARTVTATDDALTRTLRTTDTFLRADATLGAVSVILPDPDRVDGLDVYVKKMDGTANAVTLVGTVDATVNPTITTPYGVQHLTASAGAWFLLGTV